jgi:hypothetical protein
MSVRYRALFALAAATIALATVRADADPTPEELAAARQIFNEGRDLEKANDWAGAIKRFKKVAQVKMTPQVRYHMALCEENLGHFVAALNGYELAINDAKQPGANAPDVLENAPPRAEAMRGRVAKIHLEVTGTVIDSLVLLDGASLDSALFGTSIPVDPGKHVLTVESHDREMDRKELVLEEKGSANVTFDVRDVPRTADSATPLASGSPSAKPPEGPSRLPVYVAGGVGAVGLIAGGVLLALREFSIAQVRATCDASDRHCDPALADIAQDGKTYQTAAFVSFGVGLAALASAGVLYVVTNPKKDPGNKKPATSFVAPSITPALSPTSQGVVVRGQF